MWRYVTRTALQHPNRTDTFLGVGMLAGSEGTGGIDFEDYTLAHGITAALGGEGHEAGAGPSGSS